MVQNWVRVRCADAHAAGLAFCCKTELFSCAQREKQSILRTKGSPPKALWAELADRSPVTAAF